MSILNKLIKFIKESKVELGKVAWPTRKQATRYTLIVIGISIVTAIVLGSLDFIFNKCIQVLINR